jgi:putative membrane protein
MTAVAATEPPAAPPEKRSGVDVPAWLLVVLGLLVVGGLGFGIARWIGNNEHDVRVARRNVIAPPFGASRDVVVGHSGRGWGIVILIVLVALVVLAVVLLVRHFSSRQHPSSAEEVLDARFARGEIDADDYRTRRDALREARRT